MISKTMLISLALFLMACGPEAENRMSMKRSLVVIVADALYARHLSCYGNPRPTSPMIDSIASRGLRFSTAYSQTSWTLSSVASLFTGLEQEQHGVLVKEDILPSRFTTLAELFRNKGYYTAGFTQNWTIGSHTGLNRGFDFYKQYAGDANGVRLMVKSFHKVLHENQGTPVFAYLHFRPPHGPYQPPPKYQNRFDRDYKGPMDGSFSSLAKLIKSKPGPLHPDVKHAEALYDEQILWMDAVIGKLIHRIEKSGRGDEFIFVITSDHGEAFMEHGAMGHNTQVHEEMVRIPLIFYAPNGPFDSGRVVEEPVSLLDLGPTWGQLFGLDGFTQEVSGISLMGLLENSEAELNRPLFLTSRRNKKADKSLHQGVRVGAMKLIHSLKDQSYCLYDLDKDPRESVDIRAKQPEMFARLQALLKEWNSKLPRARADRSDIPPEVKEQLEALGYAGDN